MTPWVGVHVGLEASVSRGGCQRGEGGASFAGFNWRRLRVRFGAASGEAYALSCRRGQRERRFGGLMAAMWLMGRRVSWIGRERHGGGCRRGESPGEGHTLATGGCGERRRGGAAKGHARRRILCRLGAGAGRTRGVAGRSARFGNWWLRREAARRRGERARAATHPLPGRGWRRPGESPGEAHALAAGGCGERWRGGAAKGHARRRILCQVGAGAGPGSRRAKRMLWQLVAAESGGEVARRKGTRGGTSFAGLGLAQAGREESLGEAHALAAGGCGERWRGGAAKGHARRRILCRLGAGAGASREAAVSGEAPVVAAWWGGEGRRSGAARGCTRRGRGCGARFRRCTSSGLRRRATRQPTAGKLVWRRVARAADASARGRRIFCRLGTGASAESRRAGEGGVPARATG
jgi:hypothetical protein